MIPSRRARTVLLVGSAVLITLGVVFFVRQDLGTADQVASVASLFVGVAGLLLSLWSFFVSRASLLGETKESEGPTPGESSPPSSTSGRSLTINARDIDVLQAAPKARAVVNKTVYLSAASAPGHEQEHDARANSADPDITKPGTDHQVRLPAPPPEQL